MLPTPTPPACAAIQFTSVIVRVAIYYLWCNSWFRFQQVHGHSSPINISFVGVCGPFRLVASNPDPTTTRVEKVYTKKKKTRLSPLGVYLHLCARRLSFFDLKTWSRTSCFSAWFRFGHTLCISYERQQWSHEPETLYSAQGKTPLVAHARAQNGSLVGTVYPSLVDFSHRNCNGSASCWTVRDHP